MAVDLAEIFTTVQDATVIATKLETFMADLETFKNDIRGNLVADGATSAIGRVETIFTTIDSLTNNLGQQIVNVVTERLRDRDTVLELLPTLKSSSLDAIIPAIIDQMVEDSASVDGSTVTVGTITKDTSNTATGTVVVTKKLSGVRRSGNAYRAHPTNVGVATELSLADTINVVCTTADQQATAGSETFTVYNKTPQQTQPFTGNAGGNTGSLTLRPARLNGNLVANFFNSFTSNVPNGWEMTGTVVTNYGSEATKKMFGDASLYLNGSGSATYDIFSLIRPSDTYCLGVWMRKEAAVTGNIIVELEVAGTPVGTTTVDVSTLSSTAWTLVTIDAPIPANIGADDGTTAIIITAATLSGKVYLDGGFLTEYNYFGGVGLVLADGLERFILGDSMTFTLANDNAGKNQRFFSRAYGYQLPSDTTGSETIADV